MKVKTFGYKLDQGWSSNTFPDLDSKNTLVLVFGAPKFIDIPAPIAELQKHYPTSIIVGCSTSGEILGDTINDDSLAVAVVKFDKTRVKLAIVDIDDAKNSFECGENLAKTLMASDLKSVLVLSDGLTVNGTRLVSGLKTFLASDVIITGGLAGDADKFEATWILDGIVSPKKICAVGLYGENVKIGFGSKGGWDIFGPERVITKSTGNVVYEIDGQPALKLYKKYLGERAEGLPSTALLFPLAIRTTLESDPVVRTILAVDEASQSLTFAGDVPENWYAQLMRANFDSLIEGAADAAQLSNQVQDNPENDVLAIAISCVGRRLVLGERTEEEVEAVKDLLPKNAQMLGFYSYGEISPTGVKDCDLHNQTMTITTITEV